MFDPGRLALKTKLEGDLYFFARYAFLQSAGNRWLRNWHHKRICETLQDVTRGKIKRLVINMPPRYSKTELAVVDFIPWCLANWPDCEFVHTSYSSPLAINNATRSRNIVTSDWYMDHFPGTRLDKSSNAKNDWRTTAGGVVYSTGAYGTITGFGAGKMSRATFGGAIIIDDPHKPDEATSDTMRQNVIDWYQNTLQSRVNNPETPIILVMQRLHEDDLAGWLLKGGSGEEWHHLCLPAIDDNNQPLWPEKHTLEDLRRLEAMSKYVFAGQYGQRPAPLGGGIFRDSWWRYYSASPKYVRIIQSWDTAFKEKEMSDYCVGLTIGETSDGRYHLLDRVKDKMEYPRLKSSVKSAAAKWNPSAVIIEDKASGQSLIQDLKLDSKFPIIAIPVDKDKVSRAFAVTGIVEGGLCYLPEGVDWVNDFVHVLGTFPNAKHDDDVDALTQGLSYLHQGGGKTGLLDWMRQEAERMAKLKEAA